MVLDTINGYIFISKSSGIVVIKDNKYIGFFRTLEEAYKEIFKDKG